MFALYTPERMPTMMGRANSRMEETPKMYRQTIVTSVVSVVLMVRPRHSLMERLTTSTRGVEDGILRAFSRMRSKMMMVLLME